MNNEITNDNSKITWVDNPTLVNHMKIKIIDPSIETRIPEYATNGSSGMDIRSVENCILEPGQTRMVKTNISVEMDPNVELQVRSRSGLALKHGVFVLNSPGTIDSDYRGEICVILHNSSSVPFTISNGDRIAQLVCAIVPKVIFTVVDEISDTERGEGGFSSTGIK